MMNNAKITRIYSLAFAALAAVVITGFASEVSAQSSRDPFQKNPVYKKKDAAPMRGVSTSSNSGALPGTTPAPVKKGPHVLDAPSAEARINYFKQVREQAAVNGQPIPKPTSVILLDELSVTGIFRTPRGYAAIVKAEPINLSYTIYPGEKFFDGQLVAVEENRLIFRKVEKWSTGKFVSSVENKPLRKYSDQQAIQGTAPADAYSPKTETARKAGDDSKSSTDAAGGVVISPLDEMTKKPDEEPKDAASKGKSNKKSSSTKKRTKVARKN
ncbi:MAG: hypothetical protein KDB79_03325 [Acidobacteria bacterium]|nr:hypothetical protein [Acidobacteriota bacterium]